MSLAIENIRVLAHALEIWSFLKLRVKCGKYCPPYYFSKVYDSYLISLLGLVGEVKRGVCVCYALEWEWCAKGLLNTPLNNSRSGLSQGPENPGRHQGALGLQEPGVTNPCWDPPCLVGLWKIPGCFDGHCLGRRCSFSAWLYHILGACGVERRRPPVARSWETWALVLLALLLTYCVTLLSDSTSPSLSSLIWGEGSTHSSGCCGGKWAQNLKGVFHMCSLALGLACWAKGGHSRFSDADRVYVCVPSCPDLLFCLIIGRALERKRWCPFYCCPCSICDLSH